MIHNLIYKFAKGYQSEDKRIKMRGEETFSFLWKEKKQKIKQLRAEAFRLDEEIKRKYNKIKKDTDKKLYELNELRKNIYNTSITEFVEVVRLVKKIDFQNRYNKEKESTPTLGEVAIDLTEELLANLLNIKQNEERLREKITFQINLIGNQYLAIDTLLKKPMIILETLFPVGSFIFHAVDANLNLDKKLKNAEKLLASIKVEVEKIEAEILLIEAVNKNITLSLDILNRLEENLIDYTSKIKNIIYKNRFSSFIFFLRRQNFKKYTYEEKKTFYTLVELAHTIKNISEAPIVSESSEEVEKVKKILSTAEQISIKLNDI